MSKKEQEKVSNSDELGHDRYDLLGQNTKKPKNKNDEDSKEKDFVKHPSKPREKDLDDSL